MAESKEESLKPRFFKEISISLLIVMLCTIPNSTRAYIPYVQPPLQQWPLPKVKNSSQYILIETIKGYGTGYFGPKEKDYKTRDEYLEAIALNGEGKETSSGKKPHIGTIAADTEFYPIGTIIYIPEKNFLGTVEDIGSRVKGEKHIDIFCGHGKKAELTANTWGSGTKITFVILKKIQV